MTQDGKQYQRIRSEKHYSRTTWIGCMSRRESKCVLLGEQVLKSLGKN